VPKAKAEQQVTSKIKTSALPRDLILARHVFVAHLVFAPRNIADRRKGSLSQREFKCPRRVDEKTNGGKRA